MIPFNKPFLTGKELVYIKEAVESGKISGDGMFTYKCHLLFQQKFGFKKCLLTTSCTDALEMAAILLDIKAGDEVIIPSYTFVSTANAFVLRGAKIVFSDSNDKNPNIDSTNLESLINNRTKAIVVVHYAGIACNMDEIMNLSIKYNLTVVEDAAQAINSYYKGKPLGSIGHLSTFSFHETKNIQCGEGGMLVINDNKFYQRAEIIREKGTNRSSFFRGEVDKYSWVDIGSSFLPSEITAAFLYAQLENIEQIQERRISIWNKYHKALQPLEDNGEIKLPYIPNEATNNAHMFYIICANLEERTSLISFLREKKILAVFHYLSLHKSSFFYNKHDGRNLELSDFYTDRLLRLPLFFEMSDHDINFVIDNIFMYYSEKNL